VFVIVAAAVRIYYLDVALRQTYDVMREGAHVWAWVPVEANLVIMFECVPWLKPLVKTWRGRRGSGTVGPSGGGNGGSGGVRNRPHPNAVPTIGSGGRGVFKMDSRGKGVPGVKEKGPFMDLQNGYARVSPRRGRLTVDVYSLFTSSNIICFPWTTAS